MGSDVQSKPISRAFVRADEINRNRFVINWSFLLQTDYTRHSEEVQRQIERMLLGMLQKLLIEGSTQRAVELLTKWESYKEVRGELYFFIFEFVGD